MSANRPASLGAAAAVRPLRQPLQPPWQTLTTISVLLVIVGVIAFFFGLHEGAQSRVWEIYLVNLLFFLGVAQGGVVVASAFYLTQARWAGTGQYRLAEAFFGFLPLGFILFWGLYFGRGYIFPWVLHPIPQKAHWLNVPFLFARDGIALFVMTLLSWWFVRSSRRADVQKWAATTENINLPPNIMRRLSPAVAICFAVVYSLIGFDLVMSLSPIWRSTLFGAYFFESCFWSALVTMALTAIMFRRALGPGNRFWDRKILHDLGKMVFAFSIFWAYLLFSQYIVIWYGDIPVETFFVAVRVNYLPWAIWSWAALIMIWCIPFFVLLGAKPKETPGILGPVAVLGMIGIWVLYYDLVVPSLSPHLVPYGWIEFFVTAGFVGAFALCAIPGLKRLTAAMTGGKIGEER
jgi:hypothetical protein